MCHAEPYHLYKDSIMTLVKKSVPQVDMAWLGKHDSRISLYWNCGEPSETAAATISAFAKADFNQTYVGKEKSPLQLATRVVKF